MSKIAFTQRLARHTSAGNGFPKITERQAKACRHRPTPLLTRGRTGCFDPQGHPILCRPTKLCQESIPAHRHPGPLTLGQVSPGCKPLLRAPVGSNTETDDDCRPATFHRGRFRCEAPFSISRVTWEKPPSSVWSLY